MPRSNSPYALPLLLALAEAVQDRHAWVRVDFAHLTAVTGAAKEEILAGLSELTRRGQCLPAAHGDVIYLTAEGARVARAARDLIRRGTRPLDLTLELVSRPAPA